MVLHQQGRPHHAGGPGHRGGASSAAPTTGDDSGKQNNNNAITAKYSSDFGDVCSGGAILNAADYNASANNNKAYVFSNRPSRPTYWSMGYLDSTTPYYAKSADFTKVSVVGCLKYVDGSETLGQKCDIKASDGKKLTVDYMSARYVLTFYAAKTGQKIGDGGPVSAPANRCPSFMTYDKDTLKSYASPDDGTVDAAFAKLLGS
ncbi:hypothetical protein ACFQX7_17130 [Luedemannella flava]